MASDLDILIIIGENTSLNPKKIILLQKELGYDIPGQGDAFLTDFLAR